jgi:hypothetical protein
VNAALVIHRLLEDDDLDWTPDQTDPDASTKLPEFNIEEKLKALGFVINRGLKQFDARSGISKVYVLKMPVVDAPDSKWWIRVSIVDTVGLNVSGVRIEYGIVSSVMLQERPGRFLYSLELYEALNLINDLISSLKDATHKDGFNCGAKAVDRSWKRFR